MKEKLDIKQQSLADLKDFMKKIGQPEYRAKQIYKWIWEKNVSSFEQMTDLPKNLREILPETFEFRNIRIFTQQISNDKTRKFVFKLHDGLLIEGVLIPEGKRVTACLSTQVGCPLRCKFCATGAMGFARNLTYGEIYEQAFLLNQQSEKYFERKLTNIVFMGMGEPLLNLENTLKAIDFITSNRGLAMSPQRLTLSTVGIINQLRKLADYRPKFNLAVSLHSAIDKKRTKLMPVNKTNPIEKLVDALKYYYYRNQKRITIEYLLIDGITDTMLDAKMLAGFCKNFPCKLNLIEYNPNSFVDFKPSKPENIDRFYNYLKNKNLVVTVRRSRGRDINAACGQLVKNIKTKNKNH